ncbi:MAG: RNA polymerase sigma factor RpoE [Deltaproteobacteria bacterium]
MQTEEKTLLARSRNGDADAFGEIVKRYQGLVYATSLQIVRNPVAAQDVAQEAFISAYSSLTKLRSDDAFPAWLRRIARNCALAWKKEQDRMAPLAKGQPPVSPLVESETDAMSKRVEADRFADEIGKAVSSLSDALRFPVLLCYLDGIPTAEAARFLGIKEGTLRKRLHDGKRKLQERIVRMAEKTLQEYRLPRDFASRCICGCRRAEEPGAKKTGSGRR